MPHTMNGVHNHRFPSPVDLAKAVAESTAPDQLASVYDRLSGAVAAHPDLESTLQGKSLGHPLHPALSDLPLGLWTSTTVLDLFGGRRSREAATLLCASGVAAAVPTALAGLADYRFLAGSQRRIGIVHATGNSAGLLLYAASTWSRVHGHHTRGVLQGLAGAVCATAAAYLGGHLVFAGPAPFTAEGNPLTTNA